MEYCDCEIDGRKFKWDVELWRWESVEGVKVRVMPPRFEEKRGFWRLTVPGIPQYAARPQFGLSRDSKSIWAIATELNAQIPYWLN